MTTQRAQRRAPVHDGVQAPGQSHYPQPAAIGDEPYEAINLQNLEAVPQLQRLPERLLEEIRVVAQVLPFKSNHYVVDHLIDWDRVPDNSMFRLTFPQRARWLDDLEPAFGEREFFYEPELRELLAAPGSPWSRDERSVPLVSTN